MINRPIPSPGTSNPALDPITGFLNRNAGLQAAARAVIEANSGGSMLAAFEPPE